MTEKPTPRILDNKRKETEETYIAHIRSWVDDKGIPHRETDRMPMSEWPAYAEKHNL